MAFPNPLYQVVEDTVLAATEAHRQGRFAEAEAQYRAALDTAPGHARATQYLGVLLLQTGRVDEGLSHLESALVATPDDPELLLNLGNAYRESNLLDKAERVLRRAVLSANTWGLAHMNLGSTLLALGDVTGAQGHLRQAVALDPQNMDARSSLILSCLYRDETAAESEQIARATWPSSPPERPRREDRELRTIGYVSGDLGEHPVGFFLEPVLRAHDRDRYRIVLFANQTNRDAQTATLSWLADDTVSVVTVSDERFAEVVAEARVDALIDLSGHTAKSRLSVFARRVAPVQFTWLGFSGTTGLAAFDGILADTVVAPPGSEPQYAEPVRRLSHSFTCVPFERFVAPEHIAPVTMNGAVTFGCFNNIAKLSQRVIRLWAKILGECRGSRLVLKCPAYANESARRRVMDALREECVHPSRVAFMGPTSREDHLAAFGEIDVMLDSLPYTGATTTVESLAMGVPVVTRAGTLYSQRMSASILTTAGLAEWVAQDDQGYIDVALKLAAEAMAGGFDRQALRDRVEHSPLGDAHTFARAIEGLCELAWKEAPVR
ncbi:MAG: tetratricopeptide repeat protein [Fimbriimonadaceae bacterium]|nr:MAG: tetratricopeptide repeat protein [Fimbriimonadaceae bacterium]